MGMAVAVIALFVLTAAGGMIYRSVRQRHLAAILVLPAGGIDEGRFVRLGGVEQWISIRGENRANPVLLVLAGGPAMSYVTFAPLLRDWERHFTVVQWDRRGVGRTYGRNGKGGDGPLTFQRMTEDGIELAGFLCEHLHQNKIIVLGHSMGSWIGVAMVTRRPDLFSAYVGSDQMVDMARNEAVSYNLALQRARAAGDQASLRKLAAIGPPPYQRIETWWEKAAMADGPRPGCARR